MFESGLRTIKYRANKNPPKGFLCLPSITTSPIITLD